MKAFHVCNRLLIFCLSILIILGAFVQSDYYIEASTIDDLNAKIEDRRKLIESIDKEIKQKQIELQKIGGEKQSLQTTIKTLDLSKKKIETDISKTRTKISSADLTIQKLGIEITELTKQENNSLLGIESSVRAIQETQDLSPMEAFLSDKSLSDIFHIVETKRELTQSLNTQIDAVRSIRADLGVKQQDTMAQKHQLTDLQKELAGQKTSVEATTKEKAVVLAQTKNKEAEYQRLLEIKRAQKAAFEKELFDAESQLKIALDPKTYSAAKAGSFVWPLDRVQITQYFGKTADSGRLYSSGTHNGIDFGVMDGTPIKAVLTGTVTATGNTDVGACYSYGKWVLLKHDNGLSTMYAHLSAFNVKTGDSVETSDIIGYSGRTGYATGPHLHFTVYATQGMRVQQYSTSINCKQVVIPVADPKAYLDPMKYLPAL
jgi:murein DD-endopeptidase MepM/ murein hydrolase activator NlpD